SLPAAAHSVFFLPQQAYIIAGSLREQLSYPWSAGGQQRVCSDDELARVLGCVGLEHIPRMLESESDERHLNVYDRWVSAQTWARVLSPGERQRMSVGRVLFWRPAFAILDECTSSLDVEGEAAVYRAMQDAGITVVSVGHRAELRRFHRRRLHLLADGSHYMTHHHTPEAFNILVAGRQGSGKSTFLQTLCDSLPSLSIQWLSEGDKQLFDISADPTVLAEEVLDPFCVFDAVSGTRAIRRCGMLVRDHGHSHKLLVELIDTPGIDSQDTSQAQRDIEVVAWEIERRLHVSLDDEVRAARRKTKGRGHVHAVVYMVPAPVCASAQTDSACHRMDAAVDLLSDIDVLAIRRLAQYASVLVAVGKADTLEQADRRLLRDRT
ncbi:hypothetical protein LPJ73_007224, partial [Coemansia sp. RSA 2703]